MKNEIPSLLNDKWLLSLSSFLPTKLNDNETSIELSISKKLIILNKQKQDHAYKRNARVQIEI